MSRREIVADYIERGWTPFLYGGAFTPGEGWQRSRVEDGTLDAIVESDHPVALLLGQPSNLIVVDVDPRNGGSVAAVLKHYQIPQTYTVKTPSGGYHLYFVWDKPLRKTKGEKTGVDALRGVDLLADGSHVLAPPTVRVGHPEGKPDGEYRVAISVPPTAPPEALMADWEAAVARTQPVTGEILKEIPEDLYAKVLGIHHRNVEIAARASEGARDDECMSRIGTSMRIAVAVPDHVLSAEQVREDFENGVPYPIKDMDGKIQRAIDWAREHAWTESAVPDGFELPGGLPPEMTTEFFDALNRLRVQDAARTFFNTEKAEKEAKTMAFGEFLGGDEFLNNKLDDPDWIVKDLIQFKGQALLAGKYKSGKSTAMINLIKSLTTGTPFLGLFEVPDAMRVAFVDMELGKNMAQRWFHEIPGIKGENLFYVPRVGMGAQLNFRSDMIRQKMARRLRNEGIDVLIVDPISPILSALGLSENDAETVRPLLDSFTELSAEANLKGIVITHHTGHQDVGRARGATAFMDWPSSFMSVVRQGDDADSPRVFKALGRDVNVPTQPLVFDERTRQLKLSTAVYMPPTVADPF